jgi:hypothetical protein
MPTTTADIAALKTVVQAAYSNQDLIELTNQNNPTATSINNTVFEMLLKFAICDTEILTLSNFTSTINHWLYIAALRFFFIARLWAWDLEAAARIDGITKTVIEQATKLKSRIDNNGNFLRDATPETLQTLQKQRAKVTDREKAVDI